MESYSAMDKNLHGTIHAARGMNLENTQTKERRHAYLSQCCKSTTLQYNLKRKKRHARKITNHRQTLELLRVRF